jgi:hypothetical protein
MQLYWYELCKHLCNIFADALAHHLAASSYPALIEDVPQREYPQLVFGLSGGDGGSLRFFLLIMIQAGHVPVPWIDHFNKQFMQVLVTSMI